MVDVMLEGFNMLAGAAAYGFFDIGMKVWGPLAKMGIGFIPKTDEEFKAALKGKKMPAKAKVAKKAEAKAEDEERMEETTEDDGDDSQF